MGFSGKEPGGGARPSQARSELDKGFGARPPSPFLLHFPPFPPSPSWTRKEGVLLPVGVGLPLARPPPRAGLLLPCSFIYGGRGTPQDTQVDLRDRSLAVCGAPLHHIPPRSYRCGA